MSFFNFMQEYLLGYNSFFYWRNFVEILFFTMLIYYFSRWLKADRKKNLLPYFYGYCFVSLAAYFAQLTTISYFLFLFAPVAIMLFMLLHQTTLQRNFVALKKVVPAKQIKKDWPETLIRSFLFAINNNKEIYCIIENKDALEDFIYSPLILNANIEQGLIHILYESETFEQTHMLWIHTSGHIVGINVQWKEAVFGMHTQEQRTQHSMHTPQTGTKTHGYAPHGQNHHDQSSFEQNSLLLSSHTDALFLKITPKQRTFDIIFNGELFNNINSDNALNILKKYAFSAHKDHHNTEKLKQGLIRKNFTQKSLFKQH